MVVHFTSVKTSVNTLHPGTTRRTVVQAAIATPLLAAAMPGQAQVVFPYQVLTLSTTNFPLQTLAGCADLEKSLALLDGDIKKTQADLAKAGEAYYARAVSLRGELQKRISEAEKALADAKFDHAMAAVNFGLVAAFSIAGVAFASSALGIGLLTGATVLAGVSAFSIQLIYKGSQGGATMVVGYGKDRALMFTELALENATSAAGKLCKSALQAAGWFVAAYELANTAKDKAKAEQDLKRALEQLKLLDKGVDAIGKEPKAWGGLLLLQLNAAHLSIQTWIVDTKGFDCRFKPPITGTILRKP